MSAYAIFLSSGPRSWPPLPPPTPPCITKPSTISKTMNTIRAGALQSRSIHPHSNQKHQHRSRHDSLHYQPHASIRHRLAYCLRHSTCYVTLFRRPCETTPDPYQDATIHSMSPECMVQCQANPRHRVCPLSVGLRRALGHGAGPEARIRPPSQLFKATSRRLFSRVGIL